MDALRMKNNSITLFMDTQKASELIEKSEHIALLLGPEPGIDCWAAAEVLARALEESGKVVGFLPTVRADHTPPPQIFKKVLNPSPLTREFIVSLDTSSSGISQLRYEKHDNRIDVILSPKSVPVRQESFSFHEGSIQCDCIITLGIPDIEATESSPDMDPRILLETPIINIDTTAENRLYGEANLVSAENASLTQIVSMLLQMGATAPRRGEDATLLLAGILAATDSFDSPMLAASTLDSAAALLTAGASYPAARDLARSNIPLALLQLASRTAVRSKEDQGLGVLWSFLTAEDFEKTGRTSKDLPFVLQHLSSLTYPHKVHALLWQDPQEKTVRALLRAEASLLERIGAREPGSFQSPHFGLHAQFANFQEAEERLASLLKETL